MMEASKMTSSTILSINRIIKGLLEDLSAICSERSEDSESDLHWIEARIDDPALIPMLCQLGKNLEISLISNSVLKVPTYFPKYGETNLPNLLYPLWKEVFHFSGSPIYGYDSTRGIFTDVDGYFFPFPPDVKSHVNRVIQGLRQFFLFFSKNTELPCLKEEEDEIGAFIERATRKYSYLDVSSKDISSVREVISEILDDPDVAILEQWIDNPYGKHGPGAVCESEKGRAKWEFEVIKGLPPELFAYHGQIGPQASVRNRVSKLAIVPKDFRGHRLICVEQKEMMFYQQGLRCVIEALIGRHPQASKVIDFSCQEKSFWKSKDLRYTTIDLSDASDNISLTLARILLPRRWFKSIAVARSTHVRLPSGEEIPSGIFLTMGNALCFPVETLIFYAITVAAIKSKGWTGPLHKAMRVFGDDILCLTRYAEVVVDWLVQFGLKVNYQKFCHDTPVRESCGSWWYAGIDCRIARPKILSVTGITDWISLLTTARELHLKGYSRAAEEICSLCDAFREVPFGYSGLPGTSKSKSSHRRYNAQLQRLEWKWPCHKTGVRHLTGMAALYSYFTGSGSQISTGVSNTVETWVDVNRLFTS